MAAQKAQLFRRGQGLSGGVAVFVGDGDIGRLVALLHGPEDGGLCQKQAAAAQSALPGPGQLFLVWLPVGGHHGVPRRDIEDPGGDDLMAIADGALLLQGKEVQEHLQAHALADI